MSFVVRGLAFHADGVTVEYLVPEEDARPNGLLQNRVLLIPADEAYAEDLDSVIDAIHDLLRHALADFRELPAAELDDSDDVDSDEPSPFDNPLERDLSTLVQPAQEGDRP